MTQNISKIDGDQLLAVLNALANPHRLRHTFGSDMVRAGISLPALMHLMGHAQIHTTMLYVALAPQDVWREYARAVQNRSQTPLLVIS